MIKKLVLLTFLTLFACGCNTPSSPENTFQMFKGRDKDINVEIYRAKVPQTWIRQDPDPSASLDDTTKSIVEFFIVNGNDKIRIAIHNFPTEKNSERIPPSAQIVRWKRQFQTLDLSETSTIPQSFNGFAGFLLEAYGKIDDVETGMLGWAMQIAPEHYTNLGIAMSESTVPERIKELRQIRAEFTIKATGPKYLIKQYRDEIYHFARSFELINVIPHSS